MESLPMPHDVVSFERLAADAASRYADNGWPGSKDEAWRFTNINAIRKTEFSPADTAITGTSSEINFIHFINGVHQPIDNMSFNDGVVCQKLTDNAGLSSALAAAIPHGHHVADFALAHASDGLAITIDQVVDNPLQMIFDYSGDGISSHPVVVIKLLPGAELTILEEHKGGGAGLSAPVMLFCLEEGAKLHHARRLIESDQRYHLGLNLVQQKSKSVYSGDMVMAGGNITRSETQVSLMEADAQSYLNAVYLGRDAQMRDVTSRIDHDAPDCQSFQRIHGVLDNQSKAVFQGKVKVKRYAQKTDGNQMSRTLILSRDAEANTKPELEIYADDVTCSHGATIGELDSDQLFYLMSRGIGCDEARQMLIEAFLVDVVDALDDPKREWLIEPIEHWIKTRVS
jgi:Fe-S cluster assembly protein SufD